MTEDQAGKIKDPGKIPWNEGCFVFVPGRYYLGMWFMSLPRGMKLPHGGDLTAQVWRFDSTPLEWILTYRFRYYQGEQIWDSKDRKNWFVMQFTGAEADAEKQFEQALQVMSGAAGLFYLSSPPTVHNMIFKGDSEKALDIAAKEKPFWLHMKKA